MKTLEDYPLISSKGLEARDLFEIDGQRLVQTKASYGMTRDRAFFICPGCESRTEKLYQKGGVFGCRRCHRLLYRSQLMSEDERRLKRLKKQRRRLGLSEELLLPLEAKPKRIQWRTYTRLLLEDRKTTRELTDLLMAGDK